MYGDNNIDTDNANNIIMIIDILTMPTTIVGMTIMIMIRMMIMMMITTCILYTYIYMYTYAYVYV